MKIFPDNRHNRNESPRHRHATRLILLSLVVAIGIFALLEATNITNVRDIISRNSDSNQQTETLRPVNDVDYSPATSTDNTDIDAKKSDGSIDEPIQKPNDPDSPISIILSASGQDYAGGPVLIRSILDNISNGTCTLTLSNDNDTKTYTSAIIWTGTYYSCEGFDVPMSDLSPGEWKLELVASNDTFSGTTTKTITVEES